MTRAISAYGGWALAVVNAGLVLASVLVWTDIARRGEIWRADFSYLYMGGRIALVGDGGRLYEEEVQRKMIDRLLRQPGREPYFMPFNYPPHSILAFLPLASLPLWAAYYAWAFLQLVLLAVLARQLRRIGEGWSPHERCMAILSAAAFPPMLANFQLGAMSLFTLVVLFESFLCLERGHDKLGGSLMAFGTFKPQLVLLPIVATFASRRWRAVLAGGMTLAGLAAASMVLVGWRSWLDWIRMVVELGSESAVSSAEPNPEGLYNLRGILTVILGLDQADRIKQGSWLAYLGAMGLVIVMSLRSARRGTLPMDGPNFPGKFRLKAQSPSHVGEPVSVSGPPLSFSLPLGLSVIVGVLFCPHLNKHDTLLLILPAAILYRAVRPHEPARLALGTALACSPLLFFLDISISDSRTYGIPAALMAGLAAWYVILISKKSLRNVPRVSIW